MATKSIDDPVRLGAADVNERTPEHDLLNAFIGKWINEGHTDPTGDTAAVSVLTSDIYEWVPGGFFVVHTAYGRIGDSPVGGVEIIGYDPEASVFRTYFFDSEGNTSEQTLSHANGLWTWSGGNARATATFSEDGNTLPTQHEWSDNGTDWNPSMFVTLHKVT